MFLNVTSECGCHNIILFGIKKMDINFEICKRLHLTVVLYLILSEC